MKVKISDIDKMIKEEFQKMLEKKLSSRLAQINESLNTMDAEDGKIDEVEAGALTKTPAATGLQPGVQPKANFEKIGTHLKEDDDELETGMNDGSNSEVAVAEEPAMGEFEAKFAEIGRALDAQMSADGVTGITPPSIGGTDTDANTDDEFDEVQVDAPEGTSTEEDGAAKDSNTEEVDENKGMKMNGVQESVEEPLEGHSVVQDATADTINDNMKKDTHVKENKTAVQGAVIVEGKIVKGNIFAEGLDDKKKTALLAEMNRMRKFAGLSKDEE